MGAIEKTPEALDERVGGACQVVAICGRNKALIERLSNRSALPQIWAYMLPNAAGFPCLRFNQKRCFAGHSREG